MAGRKRDSSTATSKKTQEKKGMQEIKAPKKSFKRRSSFEALSDFVGLLGALSCFVWIVYSSGSLKLPKPKDFDAPLASFSEARALLAVKEITGIGSHDFGSMLLEYVTFDTALLLEDIKKVELPFATEADLEVEWQVANSSWIPFKEGMFAGKTIVYDSLQNLVVRISPKNKPDAKDNALLISTHLDAIKFGDGAGDSASSAGVMVELVRNLIFYAENFTNSVIFLWNTGEEDGLMGSHAFITQHPWAKSVKAFVDLEAIGAGGKSTLFQAGPDPWLLEQFSKVAPHPSAQVIAQDVFSSGFVGSTTDFEVYRKIGGLSGLDFAYMDNPGVYHTRFDTLSNIRPGSIQHLGDNMLALIKAVLSSPELTNVEVTPVTVESKPLELTTVYFDLFGQKLVIIPVTVAQILYSIIIGQCGFHLGPAVKKGLFKAWILTAMTVGTTLLGAIVASLTVSVLLPVLLYYPFPYLSHPWLALYLFGFSSLSGAILGSSVGYKWILDFLKDKKKDLENKEGSEAVQLANNEFLVEFEAERWLYKGGLTLWILVLFPLAAFRAGSSYLAFFWFVGPAISYTLFCRKRVGGWATGGIPIFAVFLGVLGPLALSAHSIIKLPTFVFSLLARVDRTPGELSVFVPSAAVALMIAVLSVLLTIYLLPLAHRSGASKTLAVLFILGTAGAIGLAASEKLPVFSRTSPRLLAVVSSFPDLGDLDGQKVNWKKLAERSDVEVPLGVLTLASLTPGPISREISNLTGISCGTEGVPDFLTFQAKYACTAAIQLGSNLNRSEIHRQVSELVVLSDSGPKASGAARWHNGIRWWVPPGEEVGEWRGEDPTKDPEWDSWPVLAEKFVGRGFQRVSLIGIKSGASRRVNLAVDSDKIQSISLVAVNGTETRNYFVKKPATGVKGWHFINIRVRWNLDFINHFVLVLHWHNSWSSTESTKPIVKIRSDFQENYASELDTFVQGALMSIQGWTSQFGKSTMPLSQAFLDEIFLD